MVLGQGVEVDGGGPAEVAGSWDGGDTQCDHCTVAAEAVHVCMRVVQDMTVLVLQSPQ